MFISDKLAYLQFHKTGCTHIAHLMATHIGGRQVGKHHRVESDQLGAGGIESKLIVGSIRNPWDWYVSLWAYGCKAKERGGLYSKLKRRKIRRHLPFFRTHSSLFFTGIWRELQKPTQDWLLLYQDAHNPENFRIWLKKLFDKQHRFDGNLTFGYSCINNFAGRMSFSYAYHYWRDISKLKSSHSIVSLDHFYKLDRENDMLDCIIRTEHLESDLIQALQQAGYNLSKNQQESIYQAKRSNTSNHLETGYYFDQETLDLIAAKEKFIIDRFNYQPPKLVT